MATNPSRIIVETMVRQVLRHFQEDPERSCRKLVDMGCAVSTSRFQKGFFHALQQMQRNEQSAYYALARSVVQDVEHERLIRLGMNVGYNSCTAGAKKIRSIEAAEGFNIPWAMYLDLDTNIFAEHAGQVDSLLSQGEELGVYTWFVRLNAWSHEIEALLAAHPDCAFVLFMEPGAVDEAVLDEAAPMEHVMFSIGAEEGADKLCAALRERRMPYALHKTYQDDDVPDILNDNFFYDTQELHGLFAVLVPHPSCSTDAQTAVCEHTRRRRSEQIFATIPWDMVQDVLTIDTIISDDSCSAGFRADGSFFRLTNGSAPGRWNGFTTPLKDILRSELKKA
ncbi:MAG: hypothetical protein IKK57_02960 [Clostridia bacterium]|nr:hypothetical protein [Clostridia bacterium]MBR3763495.1 hypothetical protein [Clostridia bacterium]